RRRTDHRLRLPHARTAVPARLAYRRPGSRLVDGVRRVGGRGARPRRRGRARRLSQPGARDAIRAPDHRALCAPVRDVGRGDEPRSAADDHHRRVLPRPVQALPAGDLMATATAVTTPRWLTDDEQRTWRAYLAVNRLLFEALDRQLQRDSG